MSDLSDLPGFIPDTLRWNAEGGVLGRNLYDPETAERVIEVIELGSNAAKFVMDYSCRERGCGYIRTGIYDMRLSPVGAAVPEWGGEDFKPAVGIWLWNPVFQELRLETCQATLVKVISGVWDHCRTYKEASAGLQPVIHFADRHSQFYKAIGKSFWVPIIRIIGWVPRDKVPSFAMREPTVKPPLAIDSQVDFGLLTEQKALPTPLQERLTEKLADEAPKGQNIPVDTKSLSQAEFRARVAAEEQRLGKDVVAAVRKAHRDGRYKDDWAPILAALAALPKPADPLEKLLDDKIPDLA